MNNKPNTPRKAKISKPTRDIGSEKSDMFVKIVKSVNGLDVVKEYRFTPERRWRLDYAIPTHMIAIEVEGGAFTSGRHTRGKGFIADMEKYNELTCLGWSLIRVTPQNLLTSKTLENVHRCAENYNFLVKNYHSGSF
ncbi:MAG: endonuclease domain-containing protein [Lentimicrobium sp.]|nr:endonuclease domain-containing protein [Lentimicrobium sp.]